MAAGIRTVIYPVTDLARAKEFFGALLGAGPTHDAPYYVQFDVDGQNIGLDPHGHRDGPVGYVHVDDVPKALAALLDAGGTTVQEPRDVGGGTLVATVRDPDGNLVGLRQAP
jgi:predicted enzyme related to lactoylglutathione lyase